MKFKEKRKKIHLDMFDYDVEIIFSTDPCRTFHKQAAKDKWTSNDHEPFVAIHVNFGGKSTVIFPWNADIFLIVHECSHITWRLMEVIGATHENEIMAYMNGSFSREAWRLKNNRKKVKKGLTKVSIPDSIVIDSMK
jgi:hypothetical protein